MEPKKHTDYLNKFVSISDSCYILKEDLFKKISDTTSPQGVIAICEMPQKNTNIDKNGRYVALENINDPDGTVGKLLVDGSVYDSVDELLNDIDTLVKKIEENPKKYLKISVF